MSAPYYADEHVTLYLGDCREITEWLAADVLVTDPPYPNNAGWFDGAVDAAREALGLVRGMEQAIVFWNELERPPFTSCQLVAVHIWHRTNVNGRPYEPAYHFSVGAKRRSDVIRHAAVFDGVGPGCFEYVGHPTQKPLSVMRQLVDLTRTGVVADPFAGSGSTLVAAKYADRKAIGVEIEERYCEIAAKRLAQDVLDFGETA